MAGVGEPSLDGGHKFTHDGVTGGGKFLTHARLVSSSVPHCISVYMCI